MPLVSSFARSRSARSPAVIVTRRAEPESLLFLYLIIYRADKLLPANPDNREYIFDEIDQKGQGSALSCAAASHSRGGSIDVVI